MPLRHPALAAMLAVLALAAAGGPADAQGPGATPAAVAGQDQQVDLELGMIGTPHRLSLVPPAPPPGTRGPLPFNQEPPAAQNDFTEVGEVGEVTGRSCLRRGNC